MEAVTTTARQAAHPLPEFVRGELTRIRPLLAEDIPEAARLLNESPLGFEGFNMAPVSVLTLRKKFEDEKEPGLWGPQVRFYAFTDADNVLVGLLRESVNRNGHVDFQVHFDIECPGRSELARDGLAAWVNFKVDYCNPPRMQVELLSVETDKQAWLAELGFARECVMPESFMYHGEVVDMVLFGRVADWVLQRRAPGGGAER